MFLKEIRILLTEIQGINNSWEKKKGCELDF